MSKWRKSLAMVLTAAMLLSVLPVSTWAAESEPEPDDEVVFNLGTMDVTVGTDQARAEEGQEPYDLFQADGSYTLERPDPTGVVHGPGGHGGRGGAYLWRVLREHRPQ